MPNLSDDQEVTRKHCPYSNKTKVKQNLADLPCGLALAFQAGNQQVFQSEEQ